MRQRYLSETRRAGGKQQSLLKTYALLSRALPSRPSGSLKLSASHKASNRGVTHQDAPICRSPAAARCSASSPCAAY